MRLNILRFCLAMCTCSQAEEESEDHYVLHGNGVLWYKYVYYHRHRH